MHGRYDIDAVDNDVLARRRTQANVQHRPVFGVVDFVAAEHRIDAFRHAARDRERQQQPNRFVGDAVLGIVEVQTGRLADEPFAAQRILGEQVT